MSEVNLNSSSGTEIRKNTSPQKKEKESTTIFVNANVVYLNFCPSTTKIKYNNYQSNEDSKEFNAQEPDLDKKSPVMRQSSKIPVLTSLRHIFQSRKMAAEKPVEDKKNFPVATPANTVSPSASGFPSSENLSYASYHEVCDAKKQIEEVINTSAKGARRKSNFNFMKSTKSSERKKNINTVKFPTPTSSNNKEGLTPYYYCDLEKMPRENSFEADWSTGLSLIGGNAETTDMFLATWLEKINRKN